LKNKLKETLRQGKVALGVSLSIGHPDVAEALSKMGLDYINFDTQHTPLSIDTVQSMMQAMGGSDSTPIVRVMANDLAIINRALDIGAHGVIVPFVNTKEDAVKAVRNATFPPGGIRSWGPRRAAMHDLDYERTANDEILVIPQIETKEAVDNIDSIITVDGIEAFFVGPHDLSWTLGIHGRWSNPKFEEVIGRVLDAAKRYNVTPGMLALTEDAEKTIERGFRLVNLGGDLAFMTSAVNSALARARKARPKS
jgi:2-keto-3-deoxy-L-rhamnonate aldolase RhmA